MERCSRCGEEYCDLIELQGDYGVYTGEFVCSKCQNQIECELIESVDYCEGYYD